MAGDFGAPVAQNVNGPQQTIQTISGLYGIKQQQAALGTAQAQEAQAQQQNQELQQAQQLAISAKNGAFRNPDGSFDPQSFSKAVLELGPYAAANSGQIMTTANEMVQNSTAINDLNTKQQAQIADGLLAEANDPNVTYSDVIDRLTQIGEDNPQLNRLLLSSAGAFHPSDTPAQISATLKRMAMSMHSGATAPQMTTVQGPQGIQPVNLNPYNPQGTGPVGQPIRQGVAPQIVTQPGTGAPAIVGPSGNATPIGANAPRGTEPQGTNWWNPAPGQVQMLTANTQQFVQRTQQGIQAANSSPQALDALGRMGAIIDSGTPTGTAFSGFKDLANFFSSIGIDTSGAQNLSELAKNAARYEAARSSAIGNTDAARELQEAGSPNTHLDPKAVKAVVRQCIANEQIIQSYGNLMESAPDPQVGAQREAAFRSIPHLLQMFELGDLKTPDGKADKPAINEFLKRYDISGAELAKSKQMYDQLMQGVQPIGRAKGGNVKPGAYMVGEDGPEMLHLAPGSKGFVTPNPATAMRNQTAAKNYVHRLFGGSVMGPIGGPFTPGLGGMPTTTPATGTNAPMFTPRVPVMEPQRPMSLNSLMQPRGIGNRFGMVR
jgi:hypothetical protein